MMVNHCLLHGMQITIARQTFDGNEFFAVQRRQELDTRIDRANRKLVIFTVKLGQHHSARAAISFGAPLLGAGSSEIFAQELQYGTRRIDAFKFDDLAIENKPDCVGLRVDLSYPDMSSSSTVIPVAGRGTSAQLALRSE